MGGLDPAGGFVAAETGARPGGEVRRGREARHVRDCSDQLVELTKGRHRCLDAGGEFLYYAGVLVDQVKVQPGEEGMVFAEATGQRLGERGNLGPQAALGQVSQHRGIALPRDERLEHCP